VATMLTHPQVWAAVDRLAARYGYSPSGLAKKSGLDPTSFNRSKRITPEGRPRWPSTESIAKILAATDASIDEFISLLTKKERRSRRLIPLIGFAEAGGDSYFDERGFPVGSDWDKISFPNVDDKHAYALKVSDNSMKPLFRKRDIIIVSPAAPIRKGNRVVVKTKHGKLFANELMRKNAKIVTLASLNAQHKARSLRVAEVLWIARIVWASQ